MDFEYFDDITELIESDEEYTADDLFEGLKSVDRGTMHELIDNYFTDVTKGVPDEASDMDLLMENIRTYLLGLVDDDAKTRKTLIEELLRFRKWYWSDECVKVTDNEGDDAIVSIAEALTLHRLELLGEEPYEIDFSEAMDFPIEAYDVSFGVSRIDLETEHEHHHDECCDDDCDCEDHEHHHHHQPVSLGCECDDDDAEDFIDDKGWNTLINLKNPVIDGEFSDEDDVK